jgi:hypothetical protein
MQWCCKGALEVHAEKHARACTGNTMTSTAVHILACGVPVREVVQLLALLLSEPSS